MADHRGAVDGEVPSESVDGFAVDVPGDDLVYLIRAESTLLLAGTLDDRNVLIFGGSADRLLKGSPQFLFRE